MYMCVGDERDTKPVIKLKCKMCFIILVFINCYIKYDLRKFQLNN